MSLQFWILPVITAHTAERYVSEKYRVLALL